ncbi:alkaline phosphatase family protein [Stenotrophomonas sp. ESTM1D_MKCIP4_1]|uniref:alkaline phosphatase family protein n=1 Tax=Stenotrophomonas sp. ESTM1D_MKCIP4_1 TaxID=2072414 RepID=UPI000D54292B|nr:ectonucleotide pyrophosphatase/phosphodiesterase [Stenotrophomonas sp. ESTM1D_MKCIP4_1]AWH53637.1 alkaline phosphatase family protein [Stenotrophomonas sp. ESTM1D_MKCIP4_1]
MNFRLLCASMAVLCLMACSTPSPHPPAAARASTAVAASPRLLLVSIDGLRADALDRGLTPNIQRMIDGGVRARWMTPSYPSLTFPNHYTLVTGLRPGHHGIIHNSMRDPQLGRFEIHDPAAVTDARWWGGEPIWVSAEKAGVHTATWSWPGSEAAIQGVRPSQWQAYDRTIALEDRVQTVLGWLAQTGPQSPRLATLYMENVDKAGHTYGPDSAEYRQAIQRADAIIGQVLDGLQARGLAAGTNIVLVSDHGMAALPQGQVINTERMVDPAIAVATSVGQPVGFTPAPGREHDAEQALLGRHDHYQCWQRVALPPRWQYGQHPRTPPIVCEMDEGWDALTPDLLARHAHDYRGTHGYDNTLPSMRAVFVAMGPSFATGRTVGGFDNVDVYPLLARLLNVPAAANDGNPTTFDGVLRQH